MAAVDAAVAGNLGVAATVACTDCADVKSSIARVLPTVPEECLDRALSCTDDLW